MRVDSVRNALSRHRAGGVLVVLALLVAAILVGRAQGDGATTPRPAASSAPAAAAGVSGAPLSRGVPVFASSGSAGAATDDDYGSEWRSSGGSAWLAVDVSSAPVAARQRVLLAWSNTSYAYSTRHGPHYNNLADYQVQGNPAAGGGAPPTSGWVTLASVTGNTLHSRQHVVDLAGAGWIRLSVSASDGSDQNRDVAVNMLQVADMSARPTDDDVIFYGDSITAGGMCPCPQNGVAGVPDLVRAAQPGRWPVMENGGDPFDTSRDAVALIPGAQGYLSLFPGKYVGLSYGMNDAAGAGGEQAYYDNMSQLVQAVLAAGKIPMIPTISYTNDPTHNANIPAYNAKIAQLYAAFPQIVHGPDLWSFYRAHPDLVGAGDIHPTATGYGALRQQWTSSLLSTIYAGTGTPPPPAAPARSLSGLHVAGAQLLARDNQPVQLLGVNHSGTEYSCVGGAGASATGYAVFEPADFATNPAYLTAISSWGSNTLRIGLNEDCWLGINGVNPAYSGANYQQQIRTLVTSATAAGLAVILELHWSAPDGFVAHNQAPMPDRAHSVPMWQQVADTFKTNTAVAFDLFNEPYPHWNQDTPDAWQCWRDGSDPTDPTNSSHCIGTEWWDTNGNQFNGGRPYTYAVAGMQEILDAVRGTGARNLVLLAGLQYANDLTAWTANKPTDPTGNLAASWHVYTNNPCASASCWNSQVLPLTRSTPLIATEIGELDSNGHGSCTPTNALEPLMTWLDTTHSSYQAWTWNTWGCNGLQLMTDYTNPTPTPYGQPLHDHLQRVTARLGAPTAPAARVGSGGGSAVVSWTAPTGGTSEIVSYTVVPYLNGRAGWARTFAGGSRTSAAVWQLTNGVSYRFTVRANNLHGGGWPSVATNAVVPRRP